MMYKNLELYKTTFAFYLLWSNLISFLKYKCHYKFILKLLRICYIAQLLSFIYAFMCCAILGNKVAIKQSKGGCHGVGLSVCMCVGYLNFKNR